MPKNHLVFHVYDETGNTAYVGFYPYGSRNVQDKPRFLVVAEYEDTHELWLTEDENGIANLKEYYAIERCGLEICLTVFDYKPSLTFRV